MVVNQQMTLPVDEASLTIEQLDALIANDVLAVEANRAEYWRLVKAEERHRVARRKLEIKAERKRVKEAQQAMIDSPECPNDGAHMEPCDSGEQNGCEPGWCCPECGTYWSDHDLDDQESEFDETPLAPEEN